MFVLIAVIVIIIVPVAQHSKNVMACARPHGVVCL